MEEINRIISEEYADLLVETGRLDFIWREYPDATVQSINVLLSLVNIPVKEITKNTAKELGFSAFPAVFGLVSQSAQEPTGIQQLRSIPGFHLRGQGVLIGVIDTGIDYTNPIFRYKDGSTRIVAIWDQTLQTGNFPEDFHYGTEYTRDQINFALQSEDPYAFVPSRDEIGHGTMMAGIAGGKDDPAGNFYGIAPDTEFVIVKLKPAKQYIREFFCVPDDVPGYQENDIAFGLNYILNKSVDYIKPIAICIGADTAEGFHDGRGTFSDYLTLTAAIHGVAITIGVGNEGSARRHYSGKVSPDIGYDRVELHVGAGESSFYMELWGEIAAPLSLDIVSPAGQYSGKISPFRNEFYELQFTEDDTVIYLDYQLVEPQSGTQLFFFRFRNPYEGTWVFQVYQQSAMELGYHIWLPMSGFISEHTYFEKADPYITTLTMATSTTVIVTTPYNEADDKLYMNASKGYSITGMVTPSIAAPGVHVMGPTNRKTYAEFTGASVSAAYMTGVAAMLLEWGILKGNLSSMSSVEIKNLVELSARRNLSLTYPNRDWGYGILDIYNVLQGLGESD